MNDRIFCVICGYLMGLGISEAKGFGVHPRSQSGKFQAKIDIALKWNRSGETNFYAVDVPIKDSKTGEREIGTVLFDPPPRGVEKGGGQPSRAFGRFQTADERGALAARV